MTMTHEASALDGTTLRFHFDDGPMKGKEFDHTFRGDKVEWGAAGGEEKTTSDGSLVRLDDDCYVGSYMSTSGHTLTAAMNLATGELHAFASDGKHWSVHNGTVRKLS